MNLNRVVILIRGVSGSSKSTFASYIKSLYNWALDGKSTDSDQDCYVCCADDYMMEDGKYLFKPEKLGFAHKSCQDKFVKALENNIELIIVANTSSSNKELSFYVDKSREFSYSLFSIVMEKRFDGGDNGHNVPVASLEKQEKNIKESLKLR
jgi:uridine kinase